MIGIIIGIILIGVAAFLEYTRRENAGKLINVKYNETSKAADEVADYEAIKDTVGVGSYTKVVELVGVATCKKPLQAEHSGEDVVYFKSSVTREYEVEEQETDSEGRTKWVTNRRSETVAENERSIPFLLDDGSGKMIEVDMIDAEIIARKSVDRFEREMPKGYHFNESSGSKTIGYRYNEEVIKINSKLYVLGEASDKNGGLCVVKPHDAKNSFIVSTKLEKELVEEFEGDSKMYFYGAIACAVGGVIAILLGIFLKVK